MEKLKRSDFSFVDASIVLYFALYHIVFGAHIVCFRNSFFMFQSALMKLRAGQFSVLEISSVISGIEV